MLPLSHGRAADFVSLAPLIPLAKPQWLPPGMAMRKFTTFRLVCQVTYVSMFAKAQMHNALIGFASTPEVTDLHSHVACC